MDFNFVKEKSLCGKHFRYRCIGGGITPPYTLKKRLLLTEGLAVGALIHGGICFVGTNQDTLQGAEVCVLAVMCALCNGAFNALVCMAVHELYLLFL